MLTVRPSMTYRVGTSATPISANNAIITHKEAGGCPPPRRAQSAAICQPGTASTSRTSHQSTFDRNAIRKLCARSAGIQCHHGGSVRGNCLRAIAAVQPGTGELLVFAAGDRRKGTRIGYELQRPDRCAVAPVAHGELLSRTVSEC